MRFRIAVITTTALLASGCATVDMTEMAVPVSAKAETTSEKNIVVRAANKLYAAFRNKGFVPKTSRKKMQSAASILLNGLEERDLASDDVDYASQGLPRSVVIADITFATRHVRRTTDAAKIYFEMTDGTRKLRTELDSLEAALLSSREASAAFEKIIEPNSVELRELKREISDLTAVTNDFGQRVRDTAAADMAARRRETS
jgi:hypothetical protein